MFDITFSVTLETTEPVIHELEPPHTFSHTAPSRYAERGTQGAPASLNAPPDGRRCYHTEENRYANWGPRISAAFIYLHVEGGEMEGV